MNRRLASGVWLNEAVMDTLAGDLAGSLVSSDTSLQREFEQRLADCPTLAYRVALGVLRNRAEAEDVAQEAMLRAYRNFHRLRDRFRAWLVRTAWRPGDRSRPRPSRRSRTPRRPIAECRCAARAPHSRSRCAAVRANEPAVLIDPGQFPAIEEFASAIAAGRVK